MTNHQDSEWESLPGFPDLPGLHAWRNNLSQRQLGELRRVKSPGDGFLIKSVMDLQQITPWKRSRAIPVLAGCLAIAQHSHHNINIAKQLAQHSPQKKTSIDINESRFARLIKSQDWENFHDSLQTIVKLLMQRDKQLNINDLAKIVYNRALQWHKPDQFNGAQRFSIALAIEFYPNQRKTDE